VRTRLCTLVIALLEAAAFVAPVSLISFIPRFFFGGLLTLISIDLVLEWLVHARHKMMLPEFLVCILTFLAIQVHANPIARAMHVHLGRHARPLYDTKAQWQRRSA
jgi:MFS superfamily sulfate permease-like transporter